MIGLADTQIIEEDLIQLIVVILPRVDQHMLGVAIQLGNDSAHFY
jgi:hypothetical protein